MEEFHNPPDVSVKLNTDPGAKIITGNHESCCVGKTIGNLFYRSEGDISRKAEGICSRAIEILLGSAQQVEMKSLPSLWEDDE
jgi:hypothetical protein